MTATTSGHTWQIVPVNGIAGAVLFALFSYLFFRHFLLVFMMMDLILRWLRGFRWFPGEGRRLRTVVHWAVAAGLFAGGLVVMGSQGWIKFIPK